MSEIKNIAYISQEDMKSLEAHINNAVQLWNDIAKMDGTSIMVSPMYQYSDDLWTFLESMDLPQADDGKIGEYTEHLNEIHGVIVDEDFDLKALCPRCKELAIEIQMTIQGYIEHEASKLADECDAVAGGYIDHPDLDIEQKIADIKRNNRLQAIDQELKALGDKCTWDDEDVHTHNELQQEAHDLEEQNWKRSGDLAQNVQMEEKSSSSPRDVFNTNPYRNITHIDVNKLRNINPQSNKCPVGRELNYCYDCPDHGIVNNQVVPCFAELH